MSPRLVFAIRTARAAGRLTLSHFESNLVVDSKADNTPVTVADREAELLIRKAIAERYPGEGILGEEHGEQGSQTCRWVIDPIDGTKSFVCGVPLYSTLLSYEEDGVPVVGVVDFPALGKTVWAEAGSGAFCDGIPVRVRENGDLSKAVFCTGSHGGLTKTGRLNGVLSLAERCLATRTWCDAYGHMLVAMGRVDAMIDPVVSHWDLSAVAVIIREAGGSFSDFDGVDRISNEAISCTPTLRDTILGAFRG